MISYDLQFFGGRSGDSGMSSNTSSGLTKEFKRLTKEREQAMKEQVKLRDRNNKIQREGGKVTAEQKKEFNNAWDKMTNYDNEIDNVANKIIREAPDSVFDKAASKFFDDIARYENQKTADRIVNKMTRTNKDGNLSATAKKAAADYAPSIGSDYARNAGVHFGTAFGYQKDQSNLNRAAEALLREAKKRKK